MLPEINGASCLTSPATFVDVPTTDPVLSLRRDHLPRRRDGRLQREPAALLPDEPGRRASRWPSFLLKAEHGSAYAPPACTGIFADVPCPSQYANWIEQLAAEGITGGCGGSNYCPHDPVTRQQMAVFLLKAEHGSGYVPPACSRQPVPRRAVPEHVRQLDQAARRRGRSPAAARGGNYCPTSPVTRGADGGLPDEDVQPDLVGRGGRRRGPGAAL